MGKIYYFHRINLERCNSIEIKILRSSNKSGNDWRVRWKTPKATLRDPRCWLAGMQEEMNLFVYLGSLDQLLLPNFVLLSCLLVLGSEMTKIKIWIIIWWTWSHKAKKPHSFWTISRKNGHCGANDRTSHRVLNRKLTNFKPFKG